MYVDVFRPLPITTNCRALESNDIQTKQPPRAETESFRSLADDIDNISTGPPEYAGVRRRIETFQ